MGLTLEAYTKAVTQGHILVTQCSACAAQDAIPTAACFRCGSPQLEVVAHSGAGRLFSWVVCHYAFDASLKDDVPYTVVVVDLTGGGRVYGRLIGSQEPMPPLRAGLDVVLDAKLTVVRAIPVYRAA